MTQAAPPPVGQFHVGQTVRVVDLKGLRLPSGKIPWKVGDHVQGRRISGSGALCVTGHDGAFRSHRFTPA